MSEFFHMRDNVLAGDLDIALPKADRIYTDPAIGDYEAALENLRDDPELGDIDNLEIDNE